MCKYLDNDVVLGNLFIKVIERELDKITFNKIYDFIYYASLKLNVEEETYILVSREGIMEFAHNYTNFIDVNEQTDTIKIKKNEESEECFIKRYRANGKLYENAFNYAIDRVII